MSAQERAIKRRLRELRAEWKGWASGQYVPWGLPWCADNCQQSDCEGCSTRAYVRDRLDEIEARAREVAS